MRRDVAVDRMNDGDRTWNFARRAQEWCADRQILAQRSMLDRFDLDLLNQVQRDDSQTAEQLARTVALSPSAIARRLRRLRSEGWIARTIALLSDRLTERRLRVLVFIELAEHADLAGKTALQNRLVDAAQVQFCYETTGEHDMLALFDCASI